MGCVTLKSISTTLSRVDRSLGPSTLAHNVQIIIIIIINDDDNNYKKDLQFAIIRENYETMLITTALMF